MYGIESTIGLSVGQFVNLRWKVEGTMCQGEGKIIKVNKKSVRVKVMAGNQLTNLTSVLIQLNPDHEVTIPVPGNFDTNIYGARTEASR